MELREVQEVKSTGPETGIDEVRVKGIMVAAHFLVCLNK